METTGVVERAHGLNDVAGGPYKRTHSARPRPSQSWFGLDMNHLANAERPLAAGAAVRFLINFFLMRST